jgi:hypothetical protein
VGVQPGRSVVMILMSCCESLVSHTTHIKPHLLLVTDSDEQVDGRAGRCAIELSVGRY